LRKIAALEKLTLKMYVSILILQLTPLRVEKNCSVRETHTQNVCVYFNITINIIKSGEKLQR